MTDPYWTKQALARHEATHAVAAMEMGLTVEWVQITPGQEEIGSLQEQIYGLTPGTIDFPAAVSIPDETIDLERDLQAICVAMAAPAFVIVDRHSLVGEYARAECKIAARVARTAGLDPEEVVELAERVVDDRWEDILLLSDRLVAEGKVVFATTT